MSLISAQIHGRPRVACLEWLEPPYVGGHWVPEMVKRAGGEDVLGHAGQKSFRVEWSQVFDARPDFVFVMPCGYNADQARQNMAAMNLPPTWFTLPAFKQNHIFFMDANSYFSRPGPRLAEGVAQLARAIHSEFGLEFGRRVSVSSL
jgi:iron complex transport system substrate-binding protein